MAKSPEAEQVQFAQVLMTFGNQITPAYEFITGQKKWFQEHGWNEHVAELMCAELFKHVLWLMRGGKSV